MSKPENVSAAPSAEVKPSKIAFPSYLGSSSLWVAGLSLENLLVSWILLGVLHESATVFSQSRAVISVPPLVLLVIGGIIADRVEARRFLIIVGGLTAAVPLILIGFLDQLSVWHLIAFGMSFAFFNAVGDPARQAVLNRITRTDIQRTVAIVVIVPMLVSMASMTLLSQMETLGLTLILVVLSAILALSSLTLLGLPPMSPVQRTRLDLTSGFKAILRLPLIRDVIAMNFVSALFNAGGYIVAVPIIATSVYQGDEAFFAFVMIIFTIGSSGSNFLLLLVMPILRPGQVFILLQLTRALILLVLILEPSRWIFLALIGCWGLNMGVTTTLMRSTVQELAPPEHRAQILSIFLLSFMVSSPISSLVLGKIIEMYSPLTALVPGVALSVLLFVWGWKFTGLWTYKSLSHKSQDIESN